MAHSSALGSAHERGVRRALGGAAAPRSLRCKGRHDADGCQQLGDLPDLLHQDRQQFAVQDVEPAARVAVRVPGPTRPGARSGSAATRLEAGAAVGLVEPGQQRLPADGDRPARRVPAGPRTEGPGAQAALLQPGSFDTPAALGADLIDRAAGDLSRLVPDGAEAPAAVGARLKPVHDDVELAAPARVHQAGPQRRPESLRAAHDRPPRGRRFVPQPRPIMGDGPVRSCELRTGPDPPIRSKRKGG
jgi:hypothetical protein